MTQTLSERRSLMVARQDRCIAALAACRNVSAALRETGIAVPTFYRWRKIDPLFRARCLDILGEPAGQVERAVISGRKVPAVFAVDIRHNSITDNQKAIFFHALAEMSNVDAAARAADIPARSVYRLRRDNPAFRAGFDAALVQGYDHLEINLLERARFGVPRDKPGEGRQYSDMMALRLLEVHRKAVAQHRAYEAAVAAEIPRTTIKAAVARIASRLDRMGEEG